MKAHKLVKTRPIHPPTEVLFSVIIPTLNEKNFLPLLLEDLAKQTFSQFEVIVVDGQSEDGTLQSVEAFSDQLTIKTLSTKERNVALQRNAGAAVATGKWFIFMDADNRLPSYFLQGINYRLEVTPEVEVFTTWMDRDSYQSTEEALIAAAYNIGLDFYKLIRKPTAVGALIGVNKRIWETKKFDEHLKVFEDHDFISQCHENGIQFCVFSEPQYHYSFRRFKQQGTFKMMLLFARINLQSLMGKDTSVFEDEYKMLGGEAHLEETTEDFYFFKNMIRLAKKTPAHQLRKIRNMLSFMLDS